MTLVEMFLVGILGGIIVGIAWFLIDLAFGEFKK